MTDKVEIIDNGLDTRVKIGDPPDTYSTRRLYQDGFYFAKGSTVYSWRPKDGNRLEVVVATDSETGYELGCLIKNLSEQQNLTNHDRGEFVERYMYKIAFSHLELEDIVPLFGRVRSQAYNEGFKACKKQMRQFLLED